MRKDILIPALILIVALACGAVYTVSQTEHVDTVTMDHVDLHRRTASKHAGERSSPRRGTT